MTDKATPSSQQNTRNESAKAQPQTKPSSAAESAAAAARDCLTDDQLFQKCSTQTTFSTKELFSPFADVVLNDISMELDVKLEPEIVADAVLAEYIRVTCGIMEDTYTSIPFFGRFVLHDALYTLCRAQVLGGQIKENHRLAPLLVCQRFNAVFVQMDYHKDSESVTELLKTVLESDLFESPTSLHLDDGQSILLPLTSSDHNVLVVWSRTACPGTSAPFYVIHVYDSIAESQWGSELFTDALQLLLGYYACIHDGLQGEPPIATRLHITGPQPLGSSDCMFYAFHAFAYAAMGWRAPVNMKLKNVHDNSLLLLSRSSTPAYLRGFLGDHQKKVLPNILRKEDDVVEEGETLIYEATAEEKVNELPTKRTRSETKPPPPPSPL